MRVRSIFVIIALFLLFIVSACDNNNNTSNPKYEEYYQGTEGVNMQWSDNTPPSKLYYYSDGNPEDNEFDITVQIDNEGASLSQGAVFISGYDPTMIQIEGVDPDQFTIKDCSFNMLALNSNMFANFNAQCAGVGGVQINDDQWRLNIENIGENLNALGVDIWNSEEILRDFDLTVEGSNDDVTGVSLGFNDPNVNLDLYGRGVGLLVFASSIPNVDFDNGQKYVLAGDNYYYPGGQMDYVDFHAEIAQWPDALDETYQTFLVTNCYFYATEATPLVCLDPEPYSADKKVCTPGTIAFKGSQGAPVAVTSVQQENTRTKAFFHITISNVGNGRVYNPLSINKCNPYGGGGRTTERDLNMVYLGQVRIGNDYLDCVPTNRWVRLQNGQGQITCSYDYRYGDIRSAYETPLMLELYYGYGQTMQKQVYIKRVS